eukprot:ANDGO_07568.mRNA.1 Protein transport protein yif1
MNNRESSFISANAKLAQAGLQIGAQMFDSQRSVLESVFNRWFGQSSAKSYFDVTHAYVLSKLKLLVFPFGKQSLSSSGSSSFSSSNASSPNTFMSGGFSDHRDVHQADLYIPLMAFVTFILLCGFYAAQFDTVGMVASKALILLFLECSALKLAFYLFVATDPSQGGQGSQLSLLDMIAFAGYKFVGIDIASLVRGITMSNQIYLIVMIYLSIAMSWFVIRELKSRCALITSNAPGQTITRKYFLFAAGVIQVPIMFYLGWHSDYIPTYASDL